MAYKSLYRKYRPNNFDDVSGQTFIVKTLENAIEHNKISHAYLFTGTRGTGKTTIAKIFAKMVNCINMKDNKPCGKCEICTNTNTDEIPDIIEIDAASNNGVDEIRELKNKIKLVPVACKYKVYIIDEVHMLSTGAFNALLKTLEEPPEHVIFILATTEPQKLPITIISRCQRFDFKKISIEDIMNRLRYISKEEDIEVEDIVLEEIAKMCGGAMRDAIGTLDQVSSYSDGKITLDDIYMIKGSISTSKLVNICNMYAREDITNLLDEIEAIYNNGKDFSKLVEDMLMVFRNILIYKKAPKYFDKKELVYKKELVEISDIISDIKLNNIIYKLEELSKNIKTSNYPRILFEICMLTSIECQPKMVTDTKKETSTKIKEKVMEESIKFNPEQKTEESISNVTKVSMDDALKEEMTSKKQMIESKNEDISDYKKALINNTIALATAKMKKDVQESFLNIDEYLLDKKLKNAATILKDSTVVAVSEDHILLTYKYASMVIDNDKEMNNVTKLIEKLLNKKFKIAAITESEWKEQRPYYINKKKENGKIELLEEIEIKEEQKETKNENAIDDIVDIFGSDLIEMEG